MKNIITLNNKLDYSVAALLKFLFSNMEKFLIWAFTIYLVPTYEMISVIQFLLIIDFVTGIWKSLKINQPITSKRMADSITKVVLYALGVIVMYVLQHHIAKDLVNIMFLFAALICTRETKSIVENIELITNTKIWFFIKEQVLSITKKIKTENKDNV
jgi:phage-related holin